MIDRGFEVWVGKGPLKLYQAMANARCIAIELGPYQSYLGKGSLPSRLFLPIG